MTEREQRRLWEMVCAAFDAKGTPEFEQRVQAIADVWQPRYEYWLVRRRDERAKGKAPR